MCNVFMYMCNKKSCSKLNCKILTIPLYNVHVDLVMAIAFSSAKPPSQFL